MNRQVLKQFMQLFSKKIALLIIGVLAGFNALAQIDSTNYVQPFSKTSSFRTWSVAINGGIVVPFNEDYSGSSYKQPGVGITIKNQIVSTFAIQADILAGQAIGYNSRDGANAQYKTQFASAALSLNITLANINWRYNKSAIQPYFTAGYGYMGYQPTVTTAGAPGTQTTTLYKQPGNGIIQSFFVPIGAGFKINVAKGINVDLGYTVNFVNADDFDGLVYGTRNDEFSYFHAGVEFAIGSRKKPQLATHNPVNSMRTEYLMQEKSLNLKITLQNAEIEKLKINLAAQTALLNSTNASLVKFTTDSDGDGVPDLFDKCPNTPVSTVIDGSGCPLILTGLPAQRSAAPVKAPAPTIKTPVRQPDAPKPAITDEDRKVVKDAIDNLQFDFGKATIRPVSLETLAQLAKLLADKGYTLKLSGYTDNMGPDAVNLRLSRDRSQAIKTYLVSKGADAAKIEALGYGKEHPIAPNNSLEGRILNRRVEFELSGEVINPPPTSAEPNKVAPAKTTIQKKNLNDL